MPCVSLVELGTFIYCDFAFTQFLPACKHCPHDEPFNTFYTVSLAKLMDDGSKVLTNLTCIVALVHFTFANCSGVHELNDH